MENNEIGKYTRAFGLSFCVTSILSALLVILKESYKSPILDAMKSLTGHHWVTHGVLDIIVFLIIGWVLSKQNQGQGVDISTNNLLVFIVVAIVANCVLTSGFYIFH